MTHVVLGHCCKDASCVRVCPQNCIHPAPGEAGFESAETLFIDPRSCIDCTACVEACPASAIKPEWTLTVTERPYAARNAEFFEQAPAKSRPRSRRIRFEQPLGKPSEMRKIAVVGSGPAAMYTIRELLRRSTSVRITIFEQHGEIGGLLRRGVSRDHVGVRDMMRLFDVPFNDDRVTILHDTEVGVDVSVEDLRTRFDAIVLACGASQPRRLGPTTADRGEGVYEAIDILVAENCEASGFRPRGPLGPRSLVIGAGNVAFDVIRWMARARDRGAAAQAVTEVVVLSRSAPDRASFTPSAFYELLDLENAEVLIDQAGRRPGAGADAPLLRDISALPAADISAADGRTTTDVGRLRVVLSFGQEVTDLGKTVAGGVAVTTTTGRTFLADSAICATGFTTKPLDGIPVDERGVVPNRRGRVISLETSEPLEGLYVVGWAKRGAVGGVGDNRSCAAGTVTQLAADLHSRV
ncbi:FAD-dependent oxidoreductase [Rhodococcus opacus]|uniref:ferredoxin--NADP(+) reductase n=1 Tax=Rhodococcus opacus TaxID=37919 RepID=A0AAX3YMM6_RHOOP|nr:MULTISPECIES: FAD-dependent oxidoreductase [Rhodococcus]MCZ4588515.1 FAD-dependent oxidoreductase [Rhodococcus opacus]MDI9938542.1 FAD-dependent oxidoreductase [Rhodococcus sp. IEGM 1351]NHU44130.1 FAD-dependent oxidoreductase [Rhodococcus sp. A14]WLF50556.1 FAD-dependent oxidoreductase [Rhodococcus opacus]